MGDGPNPWAVPEAVCGLVRNEAGVITAVDDAVLDLLGWTPEQLIGSPSTALIHPNDQAAAVHAWFSMIGAPGSTKTWRGRYRRADGTWCWIEAINTNRLDDPAHPGVYTLMSPAPSDYVSVEEELRARNELVLRLFDALPVGTFQLDRDRQIHSANARLHVILGTPPAADLASQFAVVTDDDRTLLDGAVASVLAGDEVDDLELRFHAFVPRPDRLSLRVCQISMRALTDGVGGITGAIGTLSDVTERVELRRELELRASTDSLTGCLNRGAAFELLDRALRNIALTKTGVTAIFLDLDGFKRINDRYGHAVGDEALFVVANRIRAALRTHDVVGRIGGDEFLVVCPDTMTAEEGHAVATRICESIRGDMPTAAAKLTLEASVGTAWTQEEDESADTLIAQADTAMYRSKEAGGTHPRQ
jgi:diguanylate cyclase (GGDEF)-like protein/PAS domain S-box-containing protein